MQQEYENRLNEVEEKIASAESGEQRAVEELAQLQEVAYKNELHEQTILHLRADVDAWKERERDMRGQRDSLQQQIHELEKNGSRSLDILTVVGKLSQELKESTLLKLKEIVERAGLAIEEEEKELLKATEKVQNRVHAEERRRNDLTEQSLNIVMASDGITKDSIEYTNIVEVERLPY